MRESAAFALREALMDTMAISREKTEALDARRPDPTPPDDGGGRLVVAVSGAGLLFALWLGSGLPPVVASHFGAGGDADGHMARGEFVAVMGFVLGVLPSLMLRGMTRALKRTDRLRLPDAGYWLAESRRPATERWLRRHFARLCAGLPLFLAHVFWLVAEANRNAPAHPSLDMRWLLAGLAIFLAATLAWIVALHRHFRR
jgi:hypothetical protein